ncbi:hypothetical protein BREVNS_0041 [Brevinematales bacterium NS]|nr:hypothetical protein [Brevinematales bacterium]QJR20791.1 hypothetical protein BREVNS_0041 [Brevinematales bacterium NS]
MKPKKPSYEETEKELRMFFEVEEGNEKKNLLEVFPELAEMTAGEFAHFVESFWKSALESVLHCEFQAIAWKAFWIGMIVGSVLMTLVMWLVLSVQKV